MTTSWLTTSQHWTWEQQPHAPLTLHHSPLPLSSSFTTYCIPISSSLDPPTAAAHPFANWHRRRRHWWLWFRWDFDMVQEESIHPPKPMQISHWTTVQTWTLVQVQVHHPPGPNLKFGSRFFSKIAKAEPNWAMASIMLFFKDRYYIPLHEELRWEVMKWYYDSLTREHPGYYKTLELIWCYYWWPGISVSVKNYVAGCAICQQMKIITYSDLHG